MPSSTSVEKYINELPPEHQEAINKLRKEILKNIPKGFKEEISYGMIGYVVPHSLYPPGYHCDPKLPLSFMNIASQKNFISVYHMGMYADKNLLDWFVKEFDRQASVKLDMGKSCIRFKKIELIPNKLIGQLAGKMTVTDWITLYETKFKS
ncbi:MAG: DUF1801 domain-containing protein [Ferruginibacter sp.]